MNITVSLLMHTPVPQSKSCVLRRSVAIENALAIPRAAPDSDVESSHPSEAMVQNVNICAAAAAAVVDVVDAFNGDDDDGSGCIVVVRFV